MASTLSVRALIRSMTPRFVRRFRRRLVNFRGEGPLWRFIMVPPRGVSRRQAMMVARRFAAAHDHLDCAHTHGEMDVIVRRIFSLASSLKGCIVEAGCFKGGSTAKLSVAAAMTGKKLIVFDSFEGIPENTEHHGMTMFGEVPNFAKGTYEGTLDEVRENVQKFGDITVCEFVRGWFEDTMPLFQGDVALAFIDVDLQSSTKTCLQHLYHRLVPGGAIFSHDGHLPLCVEAMDDDAFWEQVIGCRKPVIKNLRVAKLVEITKPALSFSGSGGIAG